MKIVGGINPMIVKNVENTEKNTISFQVEVGKNEFEEAVNAAYIKNKKKLNVPGFRKGKAPRMVIEGMFGESVFYDDAIDDIAPKAYSFAIEDQKFDVVGQPTFKDANVDDDKTLTLTFIIATYPEVTLGQYKGVEAEREDDTITDANVDEYLEEMRKRNGRQIESQAAAAMGDTAVIDFEGFNKGVPFEGGKGENHSLELGSGSFIPGFEEQVVGMTAGEEKTIDVTFPEDYHAEDLKGQTVQFKIKCNQVFTVEKPDLDDEFAKDVSEFDTLDDYKKSIRTELETARKKVCDENFSLGVIEKATGNMTVDIPEAMIEERMNKIIQDYDRGLMAQGMRLEEYIRMSGMNPDNFSAMIRPQAEAQVKTDLLLTAVAKAEDIQISDEELDKACEDLAAAYSVDVENIKKVVPKDAMIDDMRKKKANDIIIEAAVAVPSAAKTE
jgi:trigger factor